MHTNSVRPGGNQDNSKSSGDYVEAVPEEVKVKDLILHLRDAVEQ